MAHKSHAEAAIAPMRHAAADWQNDGMTGLLVISGRDPQPEKSCGVGAGIDDDEMVLHWESRDDKEVGPTTGRGAITRAAGDIRHTLQLECVLQLVGTIRFGVEVNQNLTGAERLNNIDVRVRGGKARGRPKYHRQDSYQNARR